MLRLRNYPRLACLFVGALVALPGLVRADEPAEKTHERFTGPWDVERLAQPPQATWGEKVGLVQEVYYAGEPLTGKPTRVFAYYARPAEGEGPFPAMLLVHGGGGQAFSEWATLWAQRGYVALAMDLAGQGPGRVRLEDGGPDQSDDVKFRPFTDNDVKEMWTYHAVADVLLGHSFLASQKEVDPDRIGVTGISWGGYLTSIVAGVDRRLKVAVPVYGCGFLDQNSVWLPRFAAMTPELRERWVNYFDPSRYLPVVSCPILFVNGTNDFAYPLDSYQKSYRLVPGGADLCVTVNMPHGHPQGWAPQEIGLYVDSVLKGGEPLARQGPLVIDSGVARATFASSVPLVKAELHYSTDGGVWQDRSWQSVAATLSADEVSADVPPERPLVFFLTVTDDRGAVISTEHLELAADHKRLMYHLTDGLEQPVKTADDWAIRRRQIVAGMEEAMGPLPDRSNLPPLQLKVDLKDPSDGFIRYRVSFVSEGMDRITAFLLLPEKRPAGTPGPAMLCLHQTTNVGKDEVCGLGGSPNLHYAKELAQRGYVVLAPDYPSFGELAAYDFRTDAYVSGTMKGIFNHMRCVDYLQSREDVDPERIGVIGHSLGGHNSMFVGVFDERLKVVVSCCGWCPFHDYYGGQIKGWTSDRYMPRLLDMYGLDPDRVPFDFYEVVAALAPRAFFSVSPLADANFACDGVKQAIPAASEVYKLLGASDHLQVRYPDCEHDFPPAMRREAYQFVDHVLGHKPVRETPE